MAMGNRAAQKAASEASHSLCGSDRMRSRARLFSSMPSKASATRSSSAATRRWSRRVARASFWKCSAPLHDLMRTLSDAVADRLRGRSVCLISISIVRCSACRWRSRRDSRRSRPRRVIFPHKRERRVRGVNVSADLTSPGLVWCGPAIRGRNCPAPIGSTVSEASHSIDWRRFFRSQRANFSACKRATTRSGSCATVPHASRSSTALTTCMIFPTPPR